jgi:hypothetical protein
MSSEKFKIKSADNTLQATGNGQKQDHQDADSIRRHHSIPRYDRGAYDYPSVWPNFIEHHWDGPPTGATQQKGGTDLLITEKPGKGKSTLLLNIALRMMEVNDEAVVWRGSQSRSEWLPFAPWTTLCLPEDVEATARLEAKDPKQEPVDVELEDMVREVRRYQNPIQLNQDILEPGQFHVVYPDPRMFDVQAIYEESEKKEDGVEFTKEDPLDHWWFGYLLARVEHGPHHWTSVFLDEIGTLVPESAADDAYSTLPKIRMMTDSWVDFRKYGLTIVAAGHTDIDIHNLLRHKVRWRLSMWGSSNPTSPSEVVGFSSIKMNHDMTSSYDFGEYLAFTEQNFEPDLRWSELEDPIERKLKVSLGDAT